LCTHSFCGGCALRVTVLQCTQWTVAGENRMQDPAAVSAWDEAAPEYSAMVSELNVMVAMRDGVRLATDVHRPARNGRAVDEPLPVILERTPYGKGRASRSEIVRG
jgi:predicted acyl esterase